MCKKISSGENYFPQGNDDGYFFLGIKYLESGKARANSRYNHCKGFQRKMKEMKTVTGNNVFIEIHQNTNPLVIRRWSTDKGLFNNSNSMVSSIITTPPSSSSSTVVNVEDPSQCPITSTPSSKRKKVDKARSSDTCQKCFTLYGSATDNE